MDSESKLIEKSEVIVWLWTSTEQPSNLLNLFDFDVIVRAIIAGDLGVRGTGV